MSSFLWIHNILDPENQANISAPQEVEDEIAALNTDLGDLKLVVRSGKCCFLVGAQPIKKSLTIGEFDSLVNF